MPLESERVSIISGQGGNKLADIVESSAVP
jgi:hypothetical protein